VAGTFRVLKKYRCGILWVLSQVSCHLIWWSGGQNKETCNHKRWRSRAGKFLDRRGSRLRQAQPVDGNRWVCKIQCKDTRPTQTHKTTNNNLCSDILQEAIDQIK
ncbi:unnamed protein product, partial [Ectocarpus sp. 12 AP-2014]